MIQIPQPPMPTSMFERAQPPEHVVFAMETLKHILQTTTELTYADRDIVKRLVEWCWKTIIDWGEAEAKKPADWSKLAKWIAVAGLGMSAVWLMSKALGREEKK